MINVGQAVECIVRKVGRSYLARSASALVAIEAGELTELVVGKRQMLTGHSVTRVPLLHNVRHSAKCIITEISLKIVGRADFGFQLRTVAAGAERLVKGHRGCQA